MRRKSWARPELAAAEFVIDNPVENKGKWRDSFSDPTLPFWVELGCGKGVSTAAFAANTPSVNILGVDIKSEVLACAKRNAESEFKIAGRCVSNLLLTLQNIEYIDQIVTDTDPIDTILINFCNPWPRKKHQKHRLTHPRQLVKYKPLLKSNGTILFKTDDDGLFEDSIEYFEECGFKVVEAIWELPESHTHAQFLSEYEKLFRSKDMPIHYLKAVLI